MLEIPESLTIAAQLNETVKGLEIRRVEAAHTKHSFAWYTGDPDYYAETMEGKPLGEAIGWGSYVEIDVGDYRFAVGDGTNLRYYASGEKLPPRYQTRIELEDGSNLVCTVQMYGSMFLVDPKEYDNFYYHVAKEKPMPGSEEFDYAYFRELREQASGTLSMKAFLATEQRIPGLGNGVLQDILLRAGLHPKKKMGTVPESRWRQVYQALTDTLEKMTAAGGRNTEKDLFGRPGRYPVMLSKNTLGKGCPYCGNTIQKASYLGGTVYFCPGCQEL
ncbi:endonuclease VIII [uncultured Acetatifactor sp.]|jgi:formamidopyrimidine-DNA glycosylase|uniref:endonuclease VIII n=1 Tax=uncultured Acetatifactor sp. TaxID=1671927 RepID=UPI002604BBDF|nr:endonuclease VIII [uncultured Acetatifactor sp.]